jgi:hypothetical protein
VDRWFRSVGAIFGGVLRASRANRNTTGQDRAGLLLTGATLGVKDPRLWLMKSQRVEEIWLSLMALVLMTP